MCYSISPTLIRQKMSPLEDAMNTLIDVFRGHSHREGDGDYLSRREMRQLVNAELGQFLTANRYPVRVGEVMAEMDQNLDGKVDFEEFVSMLAKITIYSFFDFTNHPIIMCGLSTEAL
ncbi:protein S100-A1-like [Labrus mixtus]|uniref:protein S100-A1-like n=1 Tax=Labrus mixtus TaxID=508554 RepID=UPI0029BFD6A5|nr:protein S100-A1-like [Labrus mixtus]